MADPADVPLDGTAQPAVSTGRGTDPVVLEHVVPPGGTVALGFADGAEVRLEADDPRVAALRAAADAVRGEP